MNHIHIIHLSDETDNKLEAMFSTRIPNKQPLPDEFLSALVEANLRILFDNRTGLPTLDGDKVPLVFSNN